MLLVQTLMTLMAGLFCRPAGAPLADLAVRAFSSVDPPMVMRIGDEKESKTIVVRTKRCTDDKKADRKKADTCENTRCVVMKRDRAEKGKSACCSETRRVITKRSCLGEEACPDDAAKCIVVMARVGADGCGGDLKSAPKGMKKFCLSLADDGPQPREGMKKFCIRLDSDDPLGSGDEDEEGVWEINVKEASAPAGGPWLGVQFGPVSKPLASQLGLQKGIGEMVLNVIEGSPADMAGLQQYDVIVRIDDQAASTDIAEFLGMVQKYAPGEVHKLSLIRGGRPVETTVTVGARPEEVGSAKYKYDMELEELAQNDVLQRGGILRKGPGGGWAFQGLGNLKNMPKMWQDLPDEESIRNLLDLYGGKPGSECQLVLIRKDKDKSLEIRRDGDKITVTRTKIADDGNKTYTTKTYTGEEELKKEDQEAFEMMKECAPEGVGGKKAVITSKSCRRTLART